MIAEIKILCDNMEELKEALKALGGEYKTVAAVKNPEADREEKKPPEIEDEKQIIIDEMLDDKKDKRYKLDYGKIRALYNAGWSINDIADEMRCNRGSVVNYLEKAGLYTVKRRKDK